MAKRDYYETLGVSPGVSEGDLKKAYQRQQMKWHPDRNPSEDAKERFQAVQEAYQVLSDPQKRTMYDQMGPAGFEQYAATGGAGANPDFMRDVFSDLGSIFGDFFGGGSSRQSSAHAQRGSDLRYKLSLDLEDAIFGCNTSIRISRLGRCQSCEGTGARKGTKPITCHGCQGKGQVYLQHGPFSIQQTCPECQGQGRIIAQACAECHGQGQVRETRTLSVKVPPGVDEGDRIRLSGEGESGAYGAPAGDLYVQIQLRSHPLFTRKGQDLHCEIPISYSIATLGGDIEVPILGGNIIRVQVPESTQNGRVLKLRGKGIPGVRSNAIGDLFCTLIIETTVQLTCQQKALLTAFENSLKPASKHYPRNHQWFESMRRFFMKKPGNPS